MTTRSFPWTIGWQPSYVTESQVYAKYILAQKPDAKIGILYQNDDFGKDYLHGVRDVLKDNYDKQVTAVSYEVTDATIDSQLVTPAIRRRRCADDHRHAEVRRPGHSQGRGT